MARASKGGETAINGEFYAGGTFLPNTTLGKMQRRVKVAGSRNVQIAPNTWEIAPDGKCSIYGQIAGTAAQWDVYGVSFKPFWPFLSQQDQVTQDRAVALIEKWNAGERWI